MESRAFLASWLAAEVGAAWAGDRAVARKWEANVILRGGENSDFFGGPSRGPGGLVAA